MNIFHYLSKIIRMYRTKVFYIFFSFKNNMKIETGVSVYELCAKSFIQCFHLIQSNYFILLGILIFICGF